MKRFWERRRGWQKAVIIGLPLMVMAAPWFANWLILESAKGRIYSNVKSTPMNRVALVLGTAPTIKGRKNFYFEQRMRAASELYRAAKVDRLLVSGDNGRVTYDEPTAMKNRLIELGVPASAIVCDYAGFSTLDSMVRAKKVFGMDKLTVVTDEFHLPRSLFLARSSGIEAIGFSTESVGAAHTTAIEVREIGARTMVFLDVVTGRQPKFLGPRETI